MTEEGTPTMRGEYCRFVFSDGSRCVFGRNHKVNYHHSETGLDHWYGPEDAVKQAVASAELDGHEVDPDWIGVLHRVANGELSADDAVRIEKERAGVEVTERRLQEIRAHLAHILGYSPDHGEGLADGYLLEAVADWVKRGMLAPDGDVLRENADLRRQLERLRHVEQDARTALSHEPGWLDVLVDPDTGEVAS